jgi:hypothetical protein
MAAIERDGGPIVAMVEDCHCTQEQRRIRPLDHLPIVDPGRITRDHRESVRSTATAA